jgi:hypothetical protein
MKTAIEVVKEWHPNAKEIIKNRGKTGYYVIYDGYEYDDTYVIVTKHEIIRYLLRYEKYSYNRLLDDRKKKLLALRIMNE